MLALLTLSCLDSVSKTNLSVHEDKNRVPFVKVSAGPGYRACGRRRGGHDRSRWADSLGRRRVWGLGNGTVLKGHWVTVQAVYSADQSVRVTVRLPPAGLY